MRATDNINDSYLGSGILICKSVKKYGRKNHIREIICFEESLELLKIKEKEIVNLELLKDPQCLNLSVGGEGGNLISNLSSERKAEIFEKAKATRIKNHGDMKWTDKQREVYNKRTPEEKELIRRKRSASIKAIPDLGAKSLAGRQKRTDEEKIESGKKIAMSVSKAYDKRKANTEEWNQYIIAMSDNLCKPIQTPQGIYKSLKEAVEKTGIKSATLRRWIKQQKEGYEYI